ncbi:MAG: hypothetical protein GQ570_04910 [Helicobacteraceae bacterium]|nr:hypothetical protein [Helicobacteraceae bacterium]
MYAVEFQAPIENGIVHIPSQYHEIQNNTKATFVVMYNTDKITTEQNNINDELDTLFANSNNQVQVTMDLATNTNDMINDGIL